MKKKILALSILATLAFGFVSCSSDDNNTPAYEQIAENQLPTNTKTFISNSFPDAKMLNAGKINTNNYYNSKYKILLSNNIEIDFDKQGYWTEIETKDNSAIPNSFLEQEVPLIKAYVDEFYPNNFIIEIDRDKKGYEVTLNNDLELIFNANQEFVGIDYDLDKDEVLITLNELPVTAKAFLSTHFTSSEIVLIKKELDRDGDEYKVYLANGYKLEFNFKGEWTEIELKNSAMLPSGIVPINLIDYIKVNYPDYRMESIENNATTYDVEIELNNKEIDLVFDKNGNFIRIDN